MAFGNGGDDDGPVATINVTPLVDVMLVLLVIFMVTAPMMQQGVDVDLPKASSGSLKGDKEDPLVLSIDKNGAVFLGESDELPFETLGQKVKAVIEARREGDRKVYVKADAAIDYGRVMEVMGKLHEGGIDQVGLVSRPPEGEAKPAAKRK